jgi:phage baseplate assembly protein W
MNLAYPYSISALGRTADTSDDQHVRDLIEQVLFTAPGERVMMPTFGSGVAQLVFAPNAIELASATQMLVQASLQQWLGDVLQVQGVSVEADDSTLTVTVQYRLLSSDAVQLQTFQRPMGGGS